MSITAIETETLRHMKGKEGLIIQGCGGDLDEWVKGINDELTREGILLDGSRIEDCKRFTNGELTCLLFPFDGANFSNMNFALRSHPGLVDIFTDLVRKAWQNLGLYEADQCYPEKMDLKGKIVAVPTV